MPKLTMTEAEILTYLDECIVKWRNIRDNPADELTLFGEYYVDAFQSVRSSLFGEVLPPKVRGRSPRNTNATTIDSKEVEHMWWDGSDFVVQYKNGQTWRYIKAVLTSMKEERPPASGIVEVSDIDLKINGNLVGKITSFTPPKK